MKTAELNKILKNEPNAELAIVKSWAYKSDITNKRVSRSKCGIGKLVSGQKYGKYNISSWRASTIEAFDYAKTSPSEKSCYYLVEMLNFDGSHKHYELISASTIMATRAEMEILWIDIDKNELEAEARQNAIKNYKEKLNLQATIEANAKEAAIQGFSKKYGLDISSHAYTRVEVELKDENLGWLDPNNLIPKVEVNGNASLDLEQMDTLMEMFLAQEQELEALRKALSRASR